MHAKRGLRGVRRYVYSDTADNLNMLKADAGLCAISISSGFRVIRTREINISV